VSVFKEFREFVARGNVVDLAVGVIIGGAFGKIVTSLVTDVVMPPIGLALGGVDFSALKIVLKPADIAGKTAEVAIRFGVFLDATLQFLVVALVIFLAIKSINAVSRKAEAAPEPVQGPTATEILLAEIRDLIATRPLGT
jgi:large conductance mechanosensitive channel